MISNLISAGIAKAEAEQIINMRKNAFNKACRDLKKAGRKCQQKTNQIK
jgi:hypothetical protein